MFRVDISKLNELYKLGIIRNKEGIEWMIEERRKTQNKK